MLFQDMDKIVFAGDSVTDMSSARPVGEGLFDNLGFGYVRVVENLLSACYPEIRLHIMNSGISGNTSRDLLARWQTDVLDRKPDYLSICIGINDVWRQFDTPGIPAFAVFPEEYEKNLCAMIESASGVKKIFLLTPYYMEPNKSDTMRARMDEYGAIVKRLAEKYGCELVDLQAMFDRYFRHRHSTYIAWDHIHPNQMGATLIAREFLWHCDFDFGHGTDI